MSFKAYCIKIKTDYDAEKLIEYIEKNDGIAFLNGLMKVDKTVPSTTFVKGDLIANVTIDRSDLEPEFEILNWSPVYTRLEFLPTETVNGKSKVINCTYLPYDEDSIQKQLWDRD